VQLQVSATTRATFTVDAFQSSADPDELLFDEPAEVTPELLRHEDTRSLVISLDASGSAELIPGDYTLRLRAGANRVGGYSYAIDFGS
jgi:hypothetical protein